MSNKHIGIFIIIFVIGYLKISAQGIPYQFSEEAPESFLSVSIYDTDVELFVKGSWQAELLHNGILQWTPFLYSSNPLLFKQIPDLYIFLAIEQSYWFEAQISNDIANNKFAAGYIRVFDDKLVSIRLGNNGIAMQSFPYLGIGNPASSFGLKADIFDTTSSDRVELMVRWDSVKEETAIFYGTTELANASIPPSSWLRGKAFRLPAGATLNAVYIDINSGTQVLFPDSYSFDKNTGVLVLDTPASSPVRVLITQNGTSEILTVYIPDGENLLELKNFYSIGAGTPESSIIVRDNTNATLAEGFSVHTSNGTSFFITRNNAVDPSSDDYAKPFNDNPWVYDTLSTTDKASQYTIVVSTTEERDAIRVPQSAIPGSLTVYRNGVETNSYEHDGTTGKLELFPAPSPNEEIRVTYKTYSNARNDGRIVMGAGMIRGIDEANKLSFVVSSTVLVPEQILQSSIEKLESIASYSYLNPEVGDYSSRADLSLATRYSVKAAYARTADGRWKPGNLHVTSGVASILIESDSPDTSLMQTIAGFTLAGSLPTIRVTKNDAADISSYALFEADAPLADYAKLAIMVKKNSGDFSAQLTISGGSASTGFSISEIPLGTFPDNEWVVLIFDYRAKTVSLYREDGALMQHPGIDVSISENPEQLHSLHLTVSADTVSFDLCEPLLFAPLPFFGAKQEGSLRWTKAKTLDILFQEQSFWQNSPESSIQSRFFASISWNNDIFSSILNGSFLLTEQNIHPAFGYSLASSQKLSHFSAKNEFSYESNFATQSLQFSQAKYFPSTVLVSDTIVRDIVKQKLELKVGTPQILSMNAEINQQSIKVDSDSTFESLYIDTWRLFWPLSSINPYIRQIRCTVQQSQSGLLVTAKSSFAELRSLPLQSSLSFVLAPSFTLSFGTITLQARKSFDMAQLRTATSIVDDTGYWLEATESMILTQGTWDPFWTASYATRISETFSRFGTGTFSDNYGLLLQRPLGLGFLDILIPAELALEGYSTIENTIQQIIQKAGIKSGLTAKAINIFSQYGVVPFFTQYEFDEYQWSLKGEFFSFPLQQSAIYYSASGTMQMELQGKHSIQAKTMIAIAALEAGAVFSMDAVFGMNIPVQKNGVSWISEAIYKAIPVPNSENPNEKQLSSLWLVKLAANLPIAHDTWQVSLRYENAPDKTNLLLRQKYSAESSLSKILIITLNVEFGQTLVWLPNFFGFSIDYALGLTLKASF